METYNITNNYKEFNNSNYLINLEDNNDTNSSRVLKRKYSTMKLDNKIKLCFKSSGANGVILYNQVNPDYIYKISILYDNYDFNGINLLDSVYSNYFKINYPSEFLKNYFPVQNISTEIVTFGDFLNYYSIDSKTILKFNNVGITNNSDFIIINKMLNYDKTLYEYSRDEKNNIWEEFNTIVKQFLQGINLFHIDNLLHGDLKSSNVMFDGVYCKIIDFGGIKSANINYYSKSCTISTRPPEDIEWEYSSSALPYKSSGTRGEMWSIGMILYELITRSNCIDKFYSKVANSIYELDRDKKEILIESRINTVMKKLEKISFDNIKNNFNVTLEKNKKLEIIEKLLVVNPLNRQTDINSLYFELFNEQLENPIKKDKSSISLTNHSMRRYFNIYRKIVYPKIFEFIKKNKYLNGIEMIFDILDRYYCKKLNQTDNEIINIIRYRSFNTDSSILLISSVVMIALPIVYRHCLNIESFLQAINSYNFSQTIFKKQDVQIIIKNIIKVFSTLSFDIINVKLEYSDDLNQIEKKINKIIQFDY